MARINLLPWREARRKKRERQFYLALGLSAGFAAGGVICLNSYIGSLLEYQTQRNSYLQQQIAVANKKMRQIEELEEKKSNLLVHIRIIQQLQASRPQIVHLFDALPRTLPTGVYIEKLRRQGHTDILSGIAESNARISAFMHNLATSPVFQDPRLIVIKKIGKGQRAIRTFNLRVEESQHLKDSEKGAAIALRGSP